MSEPKIVAHEIMKLVEALDTACDAIDIADLPDQSTDDLRVVVEEGRALLNELENPLIPALERLLEKLQYEELSINGGYELRFAREELEKVKNAGR